MAAKAQQKKSSSPTPPITRRGNGIVGNGKSNNNGDKVLSSSSPKTTSLLPSIIIAVIAFVGGVLTPPSLHAIRHQGDDVNIPLPPLSFPLPPHTPCSTNLDNYLHAQPVAGLHVVCVEPQYTDADGKDHPLSFHPTDVTEKQRRLNQIDSLQLTFYKGAHSAPLRRRVKIRGNINTIDWMDMKNHLVVELGLKPEDAIQQPWSVFTSLGQWIVGENTKLVANGDGVGSNKHIMSTIAASGMLVVTNGGNWVWPPVREGFKSTIEIASSSTSSDTHNITIETLSMKPLVLSISGFLTDDECDYIAKKAEPSMQYSAVSLKDADIGKAASEWRTSQSTFLSAQEDQILTDIEYRTASLTRVPRNHQEYVQVLRYGTNEKYDAHHDYFDPRSYQSDKNTLNLIEFGKKK